MRKSLILILAIALLCVIVSSKTTAAVKTTVAKASSTSTVSKASSTSTVSKASSTSVAVKTTGVQTTVTTPKSNLEPAITDMCNTISKSVCSNAKDTSCQKQVNQDVIAKVTAIKTEAVPKVTKSGCTTTDCASKSVKESDAVTTAKCTQAATDLCKGDKTCAKELTNKYKNVVDTVHSVVCDAHVKIQTQKTAEKVQTQSTKITTAITSTCEKLTQVACADKTGDEHDKCAQTVHSKVSTHLNDVHKDSKTALAACDCATDACSTQCLKSTQTTVSKKTEKLASEICTSPACKQAVTSHCGEAVKAVKTATIKVDQTVKSNVQAQKDEVKTTVSNTCDSVAKNVCGEHSGDAKIKCYAKVKKSVTTHLDSIKTTSEDAVKECDCVKKSSESCSTSETATTTTEVCVNNFIETCSKNCIAQRVSQKTEKLVSDLCKGKDSCANAIKHDCDAATKSVKKVAINTAVVAKNHVVAKKTTADVVKDSKKEVKTAISTTCDKVAKDVCKEGDTNCHATVAKAVKKHLSEVHETVSNNVKKTECTTEACHLQELKTTKTFVQEKTKEIVKDVCQGDSACATKVQKRCDSGIEKVKTSVVKAQVAKTVEKEVKKVQKQDTVVKKTISTTCDQVKKAVCGKTDIKEYDSCSKKVDTVVKQHLTDVKTDCKKTLSKSECTTDECRKKTLETSKKVVVDKIAKVATKLCDGVHNSDCVKAVESHCDKAVQTVTKSEIKTDKVVKKQVEQQKKELKTAVTQTCDKVAKTVCSDEACAKKVMNTVSKHIDEVKTISKKALQKCQCTSVACANQCLKGSKEVEKKTQKLATELCKGEKDCQDKVKQKCDVVVEQVKSVTAHNNLLQKVAVKKTVKATTSVIKDQKKQAKLAVSQTCEKVSTTVCAGKTGKTLLSCTNQVHTSVKKYLSDVKIKSKKAVSSCDCATAASCKTCLSKNKKHIQEKTTTLIKNFCGDNNKECTKTVSNNFEVAVKTVKKSVVTVHTTVKKEVKQQKAAVKTSISDTTKKVSKVVCKDKSGHTLVSCNDKVKKTVKTYFSKVQKDTNKAIKKCGCSVQASKSCSTSSNLTVSVEECSVNVIKVCTKQCLDKHTKKTTTKVSTLAKKLCDSAECKTEVKKHVTETAKKVNTVAEKTTVVKKEAGKKVKISKTAKAEKKVKKQQVKKQKKVITKTVSTTTKKIVKVVCADKTGKLLVSCQDDVQKIVKSHLKTVQTKSKAQLDVCKCTEKATRKCAKSATSVEKCKTSTIKSCTKKCLKTAQKKTTKKTDKSAKISKLLCAGKKACQEKVKKHYKTAVKKVTKAVEKIHVVQNVKPSKAVVKQQVKIDKLKKQEKTVAKEEKTNSKTTSSTPVSTKTSESNTKESTSTTSNTKESSTNKSNTKESTSNKSNTKESTSTKSSSHKSGTHKSNSSDSVERTKKSVLGLLGDDCSFDDDEKVSVQIDA